MCLTYFNTFGPGSDPLWGENETSDESREIFISEGKELTGSYPSVSNTRWIRTAPSGLVNEGCTSPRGHGVNEHYVFLMSFTSGGWLKQVLRSCEVYVCLYEWDPSTPTPPPANTLPSPPPRWPCCRAEYVNKSANNNWDLKDSGGASCPSNSRKLFERLTHVVVCLSF